MDYETLKKMRLRNGQLVGANLSNQGIRKVRFNAYDNDKKRVYYTTLDKHPKQKSVLLEDVAITP